MVSENFQYTYSRIVGTLGSFLVIILLIPAANRDVSFAEAI